MLHNCWFDLLPVELLHYLFSYFSAQEILLIFSDISNYINNVLSGYCAYVINLKLMKKSDFDLICRRILPEQVIALTLSDDNNTFVQSELFLSYYPIEQFTRLRSLILIEIDIKSLKSIFSMLYKLHQLRSFSFNIETIRHRFPAWNNNYLNESNQLKSLIFNSYKQILPQLNHIYLNNSTDLISIQLPNLRQLKLTKSSFDDLKIIFENSSQLKSIDIYLDTNMLNIPFILPSNQLIRLNLKIKNQLISKDQIEQLLSSLIHLKHLELKANVSENVVNGYFWQQLVNSFITFNFKFNVQKINVQKILNSFRTSFWLEEKHWYVAFHNEYLFTLPHFAPVHMDTDNILQFHSTEPNYSIIYHHLNKFTVNTNFLQYNNYRCIHIETLILKYSISIQTLASIIDLNRVEHLIIPSLDSLLTFTCLKYTMPRLYKLTIENNVTIDMMERIRHHRFKQIRVLEIRFTDYIIEELFFLFPCIENLIYKSRIQSIGIMVRLISGFRNLTNASFCADCSFYRKEFNFCSNPNSFGQYFRLYTCQVYHSMNTQLPLSIHWRIDEQSSTYISEQRRYDWYRLKHILHRSQNSTVLYSIYPWLRLPPTPQLPAPVTGSSVQINNVSIWYTTYGPVGAPPLLFIHGGFGQSAYWGLQVAQLKSSYRCILMDSRGQGRSTVTPAGITYDLMASDVIGLLNYLGIQQTHLVGWSDGAIIGLNVAINYPNRLLSLFAFAANYIPSGVKDISNSIVFTTFLSRSQIEYQAINPAPNYTNLYNYLTTMWATLPNWTQQDFAKINPNLPVWIVDADHEEAIFRDQPDTMSSWIPQSGELILPRTSHFAFLQDSDWFTASIARFLVE
ncbi:unnamed protein product, partial [Adineta steineri]